MIKSIDINNFGSFVNFNWDNCICNSAGEIQKFKKLNIIYGRNYSGKTTLSRVFRSLHTGMLPEKYNNPSFIVKTDSGLINNNQIPATKYNIRVYNKDYVDTHLGFLKDNDGQITPFAIIGSENNEIELQISKKENDLGDVEGKTGIRFQYHLSYEDFKSKNAEKSRAEKELKSKLTKKATQKPTGIKHNPLYKDPNYNTPKIERDIATIKRTNFTILSDNEKRTDLNF